MDQEQMQTQLVESWNSMNDMLLGWLDKIILNLPNIALAILVFILSYWLSRLIRRWVDRPLRKAVSQPSVRSLISTAVSIVVILSGLFLALGIMNLNTVLKSMLAGAGVAGLAIGLALQGTLANTFAGIFLAVKEIMNVGDFVETNGYMGTVHSIDLRMTQIREIDNNMVMIPNKLVLENPFKNYALTRQVRAIVNCGVSYDSDLEEVRKVAIDAIKDRFPPEEERPIEFHYLEFGDSSINFQVRFWVDAVEKLTKLEVTSEAIMLIKKAFDEHGIEIPFPIRTLHVQRSVPLEVKGAVQNGRSSGNGEDRNGAASDTAEKDKVEEAVPAN